MATGRTPTNDAPLTVTIFDVAREAGLSTATVSRVLSESRTVKPETARAVHAAAQRLGYQTNYVARSLRRQRTQTIGLVIPDITNPFFPALVQAIETELRHIGYGLLLADAQNNPLIEAQTIGHLLTRRVDGILISPCDRRRSRQNIATAINHTHVVQIDRHAGMLTHYVGTDQTNAITQVLTHLAGQNRHHLTYLAGPPTASVSYERQTAFNRHAPGAHTLLGDFTVEWGRRATETILTNWPHTDAIICSSDLIAAGVLRTLRNHHIAVPTQIAVTGFDDILLAEATEPPLTTIRQPITTIAAHAVELITKPPSNHQPTQLRLPASLITRASTAGRVSPEQPTGQLLGAGS